MVESPFAVFWVVDLTGQRPAIGQASAAVLIVLIIAVSGVTVEWIQASRGGGPTKTVTVFDTSTSVVASQNTSQSGASQVEVTTVSLLATAFGTGGTSSTFSCAKGPGSSPFLALTNVGTQAGSVTGITITWAGSTSDYSPAASCVVGPAGSETATTYVVFPDSSAINANPVTGQSFSGTIAMSNDVLLLFAGHWGEPVGRSPTAQISVSSVRAPQGDFATNGAGSSFVCSTSSGPGAYVLLNNTGTAPASVTSMAITWAGSNNVFSPGASCSVGAAGSATATTYINLPNPASLTVPAVAGQTFSGTITLSNGASVLFTSTFEQPAGVSGNALVSVTGMELSAADFASAGGSTSFVCTTSAASSPFLTLSNTGTAGATVTGVTITWAGASNSFTAAATCSVGAAGSATSTTYLVFSVPSMLGVNAVTGQTFSGTVTLSNGAQLLFSGTWQ